VVEGEAGSEAQQQSTRSLTLRNETKASCFLTGYPTVALFGATGQELPFHYIQGGDEMITSHRPVRVVLRPASLAYVTFNQTGCGGNDKALVTSASITLPADIGALHLKLRLYPILAYCGPGNIDSTIHVAPVEPTLNDTLSV
jgi:hypothetical protein